MALGTSDDVVVTALVDRRWRAVDEGWSGVKHNWALPPLRGETAREGKSRSGARHRDGGISPLLQRGQTSGETNW